LHYRLGSFTAIAVSRGSGYRLCGRFCIAVALSAGLLLGFGLVSLCSPTTAGWIDALFHFSTALTRRSSALLLQPDACAPAGCFWYIRGAPSFLRFARFAAFACGITAFPYRWILQTTPAVAFSPSALVWFWNGREPHAVW
jgi:hypothetical protein